MVKPYPFFCNPCQRECIYPYQIESSLYCPMCGAVIRNLRKYEKAEFSDHVIHLEANLG